jgi:hypothetical protein
MAKKKKPGRPVGSTAVKTHDTPIQFKAFLEERDKYRRMADSKGLTLSAWIRMTLNDASRDLG